MSKHLIKLFAITDLKSRYRNSFLGFAWTIIEPLLILSILFLVFTHIMKLQIENYPLHLLLGIILWNGFARGTNMGIACITNRTSIIKNIYFPREILPLSSTITSLLMFCFEFLIFVIFLAVFKFVPTLSILYLVPIVFLYFFLILGISFPLSVLSVKFKDMQYIWTIILQAGFFISPIIYQLDMFPNPIKQILLLSPVAQIINMSYDVTLLNSLPPLGDVVYTILISLAIFIIGYIIFIRLQKNIVEVI